MVSALCNPCSATTRIASGLVALSVVAAAMSPVVASAALTGSLERPGAILREHDPFQLIVSLGNSGGLTVSNLALTFTSSAPDRIAILASPVPAATQVIDAGIMVRFTWSLRAEQAGPQTFTVVATGYAGGAVTATAVRRDAISPKPAGVTAYPDPVAGDTLRLALNLTDDADTVTADVFNASFHRIAESSWRDIRRDDGQVVLNRVSAWAPGVYAIRVTARLAGGGEQVFPLAKVQVKR